MYKLSNSLRITGLASGLDVDSIVKQLMRTETAKVDKVKQQRQLIQWRQEIYRDLMGDLNSFKNTYFNVLNSKDYILSQNTFSSFDVKSTDSTNAVTATANAGAIAGKYKVNVKALAEKAIYTSGGTLNTVVANLGTTLPIKIDATNKSLSIDSETITLTEGKYNNLNELALEINSKIAVNSNLKDKVKAVVKDNGIQFAHTVQIFDSGVDKNNEMNISTGSSSFKVTLAKGFYTLDEITAQVNSKLKTAKDSSGNGIPEGFRAEVTADGLSIGYTLGGFDDKSFSIPSLASLTGAGTGTPTGTEPNFSSDRLTYKKDIITGFNDTLTFKVGDKTHEIKLDAAKDYSGMSDSAITQDFVDQINAALMPLGVGVSAQRTSDDRIKFISTTNNQVTIGGNAATMIGVSNGFQINQSTKDSITNIFSGKVKFTVNGVEFKYDFDSADDVGAGTDKVIGGKNKSLSDILSNISTKANVDITYSQLTRKFTIATKTTGSDQAIVDTKDIIDSEFTQSFLGTLFGTSTIADISGKDAEVEITEPGGQPTTLYQSSNSFTLDGVTYTLNEKPSAEVVFTLVTNSSSSYEKIKGFIDKYNEIIDKISSKLVEKKQYAYAPLTDEQKENMKEDQIKKWEERAKQGLIKNDSTLDNALTNMRNAFYESVKQTFSDPQMSNIGITLNEIGMSTSTDYSQRGKIIIDEKKLKDALQNNGEKVAELFTKVSSTVPSYTRDLTTVQRSQRYKESGIFQRIKDILEDNLSTIRNLNGKKGTLLEKAGIKGDYTEYHNLLTDELDEKDKLIDTMNKKLISKEKLYYLQYSKLETAMQRMNSQQSWFTQQMGAMNGGS